MMSLESESINQVKGVDGYLVFDLDLNLIDQRLKQDFDLQEFGYISNKLLNSLNEVNHLETSVMLTEKGVLALSVFDNFYLMVIAGHTDSVDITKLLGAISMMKQEYMQQKLGLEMEGE